MHKSPFTKVLTMKSPYGCTLSYLSAMSSSLVSYIASPLVRVHERWLEIAFLKLQTNDVPTPTSQPSQRKSLTTRNRSLISLVRFRVSEPTEQEDPPGLSHSAHQLRVNNVLLEPYSGTPIKRTRITRRSSSYVKFAGFRRTPNKDDELKLRLMRPVIR